jgi:hypothetical protein
MQSKLILRYPQLPLEYRQRSIKEVSLQCILRDPLHLIPYREFIKKVNILVTAGYLLARYIFLYEYEDNDEFNADEYITTEFFRECLLALQIQPRHQSRADYTIQNRQLIRRYLEEFCVMYRFHRMNSDGFASNWEAYVRR